MAFPDTILTLSVYHKRSFDEKMESHTKPNVFTKCLRNDLLFPARKESMLVRVKHTFSRRYRCTARHPLQFFT